MTPAELKTKMEALGVHRSQVYERAGIVMQHIYVLSSPKRTLDVPEYVAAVVLELEQDAEAAADRLATEYLSDPEAEVLPRYTSLADFHRHVPELDGWPLDSQGPLLTEVCRRIDRPVRIEWAA
jgi:hypothetical protein